MPPRTKQTEDSHVELKKQGGQWLKELREKAGHTQRSFAIAVGVDYYTFISQIETGRGSVPKERYAVWAKHLNMEPKQFLRGYMRYFDPISYGILFGDESQLAAVE
ncbi:MAG: helix-turn-helix transcriptional regulator [Hyphomicrobiales bacterium]|nr:helix-turn-helix transcriptional regulator [Hyphomicrobiales bacterium]